MKNNKYCRSQKKANIITKIWKKNWEKKCVENKWNYNKQALQKILTLRYKTVEWYLAKKLFAFKKTSWFLTRGILPALVDSWRIQDGETCTTSHLVYLWKILLVSRSVLSWTPSYGAVMKKWKDIYTLLATQIIFKSCTIFNTLSGLKCRFFKCDDETTTNESVLIVKKKTQTIGVKLFCLWGKNFFFFFYKMQEISWKSHFLKCFQKNVKK